MEHCPSRRLPPVENKIRCLLRQSHTQPASRPVPLLYPRPRLVLKQEALYNKNVVVNSLAVT